LYQSSDEEKEYQIEFMANIYGKANRVVVWLGKMMDSSDEALEAIRAAGIKLMRNSGSQKSEQAVTSLLEREWFQRIWVRQQTFNIHWGEVLTSDLGPAGGSRSPAYPNHVWYHRH
jgi:hypothetical protein